MLLFSCPNLLLFVFGVCQRWQTEAMGEKGLEIASNLGTKPTKVFNFPIWSQSHLDYPLSGVNEVRSQKSEVPHFVPALANRSCFCNEDLCLAPKTFRFKKPGFRPYYLDNKRPEIRTSLTLKSGWPRPIFPIPR